MSGALEALGALVQEAARPEIRVRVLGKDVINLDPDGKPLLKADVDSCRAVLAAVGWREVRSWIALEHANWLSDGFQSVSFKVAPK